MAVNDIPLKMSICNDLHVATTAVESVKILPQDLQHKTVGSSATFRSMSGPLSASRSATCGSAFAFSKGTPELGGWLWSRPPASMVTLFYVQNRVEVRSFGTCILDERYGDLDAIQEVYKSSVCSHSFATWLLHIFSHSTFCVQLRLQHSWTFFILLDKKSFPNSWAPEPSTRGMTLNLETDHVQPYRNLTFCKGSIRACGLSWTENACLSLNNRSSTYCYTSPRCIHLPKSPSQTLPVNWGLSNRHRFKWGFFVELNDDSGIQNGLSDIWVMIMTI